MDHNEYCHLKTKFDFLFQVNHIKNKLNNPVLTTATPLSGGGCLGCPHASTFGQASL